MAVPRFILQLNSLDLPSIPEVDLGVSPGGPTWMVGGTVFEMWLGAL